MLSGYGKLLRKIRIDYGELLYDMAKKLKISPTMLSYIENGKREIPQDFTEKVITCYGLREDIAEQLRLEESQYRKTIKMELSSIDSIEKRKTVMLFARTFNNINDEVLAKIRKLLEKGKC